LTDGDEKERTDPTEWGSGREREGKNEQEVVRRKGISLSPLAEALPVRVSSGKSTKSSEI